MFAIFDSAAEATAFIAECDQLLGYPKPGNPATPANDDGSPGFGWTTTWAEPVAHPDGTRWAVVIPDGYSTAADTLESLSSDWFPPLDF